MSSRPAHPDDIPKVSTKRGATITRTRFGYNIRYSHGVGISEKTHSWRPTLGMAERCARRFVRGPKPDSEIVGRFGADERPGDDEAYPPLQP